MKDTLEQRIIEYCEENNISTDKLQNKSTISTGLKTFIVYKDIIFIVDYGVKETRVKHVKNNRINRLLLLNRPQMRIAAFTVIMLLLLSIIIWNKLNKTIGNLDINSNKTEYPKINVHSSIDSFASCELDDVITVNNVEYSIDSIDINICSDNQHARLIFGIKIHNKSDRNAINIKDIRVFPETSICDNFDEYYENKENVKSSLTIDGLDIGTYIKLNIKSDESYILYKELDVGIIKTYNVSLFIDLKDEDCAIVYNIPLQKIIEENT